MLLKCILKWCILKSALKLQGSLFSQPNRHAPRERLCRAVRRTAGSPARVLSTRKNHLTADITPSGGDNEKQGR